MGPREFLRSLPDQPVSVRRRFVAIATTATFVLVVLVWAGLVGFGRRSAVPPATPTPVAGDAPAETRGEPGTPEPVVPDPDLDALSANLLKALRPSPTPTQ